MLTVKRLWSCFRIKRDTLRWVALRCPGVVPCVGSGADFDD